MSRASSLVPATLLVSFSLLLGCECDRAPDEGRGATTAGERAENGEATDEEAAQGEAAERAQPGPIGRTLAVFDDGTVTTRLFVFHRVGDAEAEAPADATLLGSAWIGGDDSELSVVSEGEATDRTAVLFGPIGSCSARILRTVSLRGTVEGQTPSTYGALEVAPCDGISVESLEATYPFGVEGDVTVEQLLASTMSAATDAQREIVAEAEREAGDGEEMDLQVREIGDTHVAVLAGWQSYAVRDGAILATYEDGIPAWASVGTRTYLLARDGRHVRLLAVGADGLSPVILDRPPPSAGSDETSGAAESEP